jgi:hypothetical protein
MVDPLPVTRSKAKNPAPPPEPPKADKQGRILIRPRKRVLIPRADAFIASHYRVAGESFVLEGEEVVSVYGKRNPDGTEELVGDGVGVFLLVSDEPAQWAQMSATPAAPTA